MKIRRPAKAATPGRKLSDACHTSQADIERIVNGAKIPPGGVPPAPFSRPARRHGRST